MACERVSVAVNSGGVGELLVDGMTGVLTGEAPADIVAAMREVVSWSPEERAEVGRRARRHVIERHDQATQVGVVASIIEGSFARGGSA
jgi:glycosyltransferase involved in cell wall biosynthesis